MSYIMDEKLKFIYVKGFAQSKHQIVRGLAQIPTRVWLK